MNKTLHTKDKYNARLTICWQMFVDRVIPDILAFVQNSFLWSFVFYIMYLLILSSWYTWLSRSWVIFWHIYTQNHATITTSSVAQSILIFSCFVEIQRYFFPSSFFSFFSFLCFFHVLCSYESRQNVM